MTITDRDLGYRALFRRVVLLDEMHVTAGVHSDRGDEAHDEGGLTIAEIAAVHEFGVPGHIHPRSWLRETIDIKEVEIQKFAVKIARSIVKKSKHLEPRRGGEILGQFMVNVIKNRIREGIPPSILPETAERKGASTPLIDSGVFINSIESKVSL